MTTKKVSPTLRLLSLLKDRKLSVVFLLVLIIIAQGLNITVPFISKILIDSLTNYLRIGGEMPWMILVYSALSILFATVISSIAQSSYNYHLFKLVTKTEDKVRNLAFAKYLELQALFHHGSSSGQIIGRIERGGISIYAILNDIIGQNLLPPLIVFIGTFVALLYQNVWIALAVIVPFPIYFLITKNISNKIYEIEKQVNEAFEAVSKEGYDVAGNVLTVKKFSQELAETENQKKLMEQAREIQYGAERLWGVIENVQTIITTTSRVLVLSLSAWLVLSGQATIGQFVLYITLQNMAYQPLAQLSVIFPRLRRNTTRLERLFMILDEPVLIKNKKNAITLTPLKKQIEFKNVSFAYQEKDLVGDSKEKGWALKNINLIIPAGKTIALVGRSGSGKTTFINLLLRSFDPQEGKILFDGVDIRDATQESLRNQIAVVPQEVDLFSRTVAENIAYGKPVVTKDQIKKAAETALSHDFIMKIDNKYETVVGERGIKLSGGERQRIGIARAVLRDPKILILDEATSHLDTESEKLISEATDALIKNRTSIIIAHRFSTILHADLIVVFKDRQIEAVGTHLELLEKSPTYKKLYSLQFVD
ncbi:MAG: ABC transporter ATP-binding protein [Candidatus Paceibacterota bacterium]